MAATLDYADRQPRRGAPWWLWALATLTVMFGFFWFWVPVKMRGNSDKALAAAARADVLNLRTALDALAQDSGRYPTQLEGLGALVRPPGGLAGWRGPYLRGGAPPVDPWGRPYEYSVSADGKSVRVTSLGRDGKRGTADDVASP